MVSDRVEAELPPGGGDRHLARVVRAPGRHARRPRGGPTWRSGLGRLGRSTRRALVVVLSDFLDDRAWRRRASGDAPRSGTRCSRSGSSTRARSRLPDAGLVDLEDAETGARRVVDSGSRRVRDAYARAADDRRAAFRRWCSTVGRRRVRDRHGRRPDRPPDPHLSRPVAPRGPAVTAEPTAPPATLVPPGPTPAPSRSPSRRGPGGGSSALAVAGGLLLGLRAWRRRRRVGRDARRSRPEVGPVRDRTCEPIVAARRRPPVRPWSRGSARPGGRRRPRRSPPTADRPRRSGSETAGRLVALLRRGRPRQVLGRGAGVDGSGRRWPRRGRGLGRARSWPGRGEVDDQREVIRPDIGARGGGRRRPGRRRGRRGRWRSGKAGRSASSPGGRTRAGCRGGPETRRKSRKWAEPSVLFMSPTTTREPPVVPDPAGDRVELRVPGLPASGA